MSPFQFVAHPNMQYLWAFGQTLKRLQKRVFGEHKLSWTPDGIQIVSGVQKYARYFYSVNQSVKHPQ